MHRYTYNNNNHRGRRTEEEYTPHDRVKVVFNPFRESETVL